MYRCLFRTAKAARNRTVNVYEAFLSPVRGNEAAASDFSCQSLVGPKAFSTGPARLCEKTVDVAPPKQDEKNTTETVTEGTAVAERDAGHEDQVVKMSCGKEDPALPTADHGSSSSSSTQQPEVAKPKPVVKTTKESLLEVLGAMKVEMTSTRTLKSAKKIFHPRGAPPAMQSTISMFQEAKKEASAQSETELEPELVAAASAAAATLPNKPSAVSQLLQQLRQQKATSAAQKKGQMEDLGAIIADMKVGKRTRSKSLPFHEILYDEDFGQGFEREIPSVLNDGWAKRTLFTEERLNIFSPTQQEDKVESAVERHTLWDVEFANELSKAICKMPRNSLEEMIQWTREGKLWQYPIDNEIGLEEEASVPFHEHIFLEKHLEEGFPRQGPVRHFMELVVAGLSKNPYLSVQQKKEHISWFRDYFHQKEDVLKEASLYLS